MSSHHVLAVAGLALLFGAGNTFTTKVLITALPCEPHCAPPGAAAVGTPVPFNKPIFTALVAFAGMAASGAYYLVHCLRGHVRRQRLGSHSSEEGGLAKMLMAPAIAAPAAGAPCTQGAGAVFSRYRPLALPAALDVTATCLQAAAALFIPAAVNAALRGSILVFTALANRAMGVRDASASARELRAMGLSVLGVTIVGLSSVLNGSSAPTATGLSPASAALLGVALALASNVVQAVQVAFETLYLEGAVYEPVEVS